MGGNVLKNKRLKNKKPIKKKTAKKTRGIGAFFGGLTDGFVRAIKRGLFGFVFADLYTKCNEKWKKGFIYNLFRKRKQKIRDRATLAHIYEESLLNKKLLEFFDGIVHSHMRYWGVLLLFFGLAVSGTAIVKNYYFGDNTLTDIITGAVVVILSLPFVISRREFGEALLNRRFTRFLITNVLNLNPTRFESEGALFEGSYFAAILLSVGLGVSTYFISPLLIVSLVILLLLFILTMSFPEFGLILLMIMLPFANAFPNPTVAILILLGFASCGFISKLIRGKRVIRFELIDVMVAAFSALLLFGGIFTCGGVSSLHSAEVYFAFLFVYFLIVNMYIGKSSIYRAFKVLVATASIVSLVGIVKGGVIDPAWVDLSMFNDLPGRVNVFLGNPNMLGVYLVIAFPLALAQMKVSQKKISKFLYFICAALIFACTVMTGSRGAWLGLLVSAVLYLVIYNFKNIWIVIVGGVAVPLLQFVVPQYIVNRFVSIFTMADSSIQMRLDIWRGAWNMAKDNIFTGIGVGDYAYKIVYDGYAIPGADSAVHAHSLPLQILIDVGIVGLVVFGIIMFMYLQSCSVEIKHGAMKSKSRTMIIAGLSSILGALTMGFADNIWYNYRVFIMFWIVVALTVALTKTNVRERESTRIIANMTSADLEINR